MKYHKVQLKSYEDIKWLFRSKKIDMVSATDDGEIVYWKTVGNPFSVFPIYNDDYDSEFMVVDHPNPISREVYERLAVFFEKPSCENHGNPNCKVCKVKG